MWVYAKDEVALSWEPHPESEQAAWLTANCEAIERDDWWLSVFYPHVGRILHPARNGRDAVSWAQVAAHTGVTLEADTVFADFLGHDRDDPNYEIPGLYDERPWLDLLPDDVLEALLAILTPQPEWGLIWPDTAGLERLLQQAASFADDQPHRTPYRMLRRTTETVDRELTGRGPNIWWPDDRSWCIYTGIDFDWTLIGTRSPTLFDRLTTDPAIEMLTPSARP
ncbi:hypothetical protein [Nocardia sp. NPDC051570]|uniref:hypothetical protein n=1 Tax=Nocardia sp. NPDC051570 TaxID=3364324 RepID=UPI0037ABA295